MEEFNYTLNVDNDTSYFRLISANAGIKSWNSDGPVLYLISPEDKVGTTVTFIINGEESDLEITSTLMNWTLKDLGIMCDYGFDVGILEGDEQVADTYFNVDFYHDFVDFEPYDEEKHIFIDSLERVIGIYVHEDVYGNLEVFVNDEKRFKTAVYEDTSYEWDLNSLGITQTGDYNVTLILHLNDEMEIIKSYTFYVREFENDTFRAKIIVDDDENKYLYLFSPAGQSGTISLTFKHWKDEIEDYEYEGTETLELNETHWNKWTLLRPFLSSDVDVSVDDEDVYVEYYWWHNGGNSFDVNTDDEIRSGDDAVVWLCIDSPENNYTINIESGDYKFAKNVSELGDYDEWANGNYKYSIKLDDLDSFSSINDKDKIRIFFDVGTSLSYGWLPFSTFTIEKNDDYIKIHYYEDLRIDLIKIELAFDEDEEDEDDSQSEIPQEEIRFVRITVPDSLNITETGKVHINYGDYDTVKDLSSLDYEYDYECLGKEYYILLGDLNLENLKNKDVVNITVTSDDEIFGSRCFAMHLTDEGWESDYFKEAVELSFYYGEIGNLEFGVDGDPDKIFDLNIPEHLNITEGTIIIADENGTVIFSKSLSEFEEEHISYDGFQSYSYWIPDGIDEFDYSCFKENVPFTVSFAYNNTTEIFAKGVRTGDRLWRINTPYNVAELYKISISDNVLINDSDNVIVIEATDRVNRQSVNIDLGGGYFVVYVNDKKVEDLGRLIRINNETELDLFRLSGGWRDGATKLYIYLSDLNITDNGLYNVKVAHKTSNYDDETVKGIEVVLFNKNVTLTSNVKANYQNESVELLTGYGVDPVLLYLDTYYDEIDDVTGKITVYNDKSEKIFESDIKDLPLEDNRRYLSYSDFVDDFGDNITLIYSDGSERSGNTTLAVKWRNVTSDDFTPAVNEDVDDYYGDFISLNIPDTINEGQIIVTIKFKNNHGVNISNIDVDTDFGSKAVYTFNVADIKANCGNDFDLAFYDFGFYEDNGDYEIDVKFTADNVNVLNVTEKNVNVQFKEDVLISINESTRYGITLPFASVRVFEPINAYGELYIDGKLYSHKTFERGLITFVSSASWAPGVHTAEIIVFNSEFGSVLNSSNRTFETLIQTSDIDVNVTGTINEGENATLIINVPKEGKLFIQKDGENGEYYAVTQGENAIDLGILTKGNHTVWVVYNETLDDGTASFYNNYLTICVNDAGYWLKFPEQLVLNEDDTLRVDFGEDAKGYVLLYIDGELVANLTLVNGSAETTISQYLKGENLYGKHIYTVECYDENGIMLLSRNGTFNVAYLFKDNIIKEGYPLKEYYEITITLPFDAKGNVTLTVDGKAVTAEVINGQATFNLENLSMGEHDVLVNYTGDDKYPPSCYSNVLNISYYGVVGNFKDGKRIISLMLPSNATGSLVVHDNNKGKELRSQAIVNGKAVIDLSQLTVGIYDVIAYYEGDDYDVRTFECSFKVLPEVYITPEVIIGDNVTVTMDLNGASGSILIVVDGLTPALCDIVDGKVYYTFSTEELAYGNHSIYFIYFGTSFDKDVLNDVNDDGRYGPIMYYWKALPKIVNPKLDSEDNVVYISVGNATGTIEVFIDGVSQGVVDIVNGIAGIDLSGFANGKHTITWVYSGDDKYAPFSKTSDYTVNNRIVATDMNAMYSANQKYSVTVYGSEGKAISGVTVNFLINNKAYASAKTNEKGVATIVIKSSPGTYTITSKTSSVSVNKKLTVSHVITLKKVTVKRSAKKLVLQATLKKVNGKYLKNKKITFKFKGKKYTAKTNKKGVAKVTVKFSVLKKLKVGKKVTYQATYLKDTVKKTVKVKK